MTFPRLNKLTYYLLLVVFLGIMLLTHVFWIKLLIIAVAMILQQVYISGLEGAERTRAFKQRRFGFIVWGMLMVIILVMSYLTTGSFF